MGVKPIAAPIPPLDQQHFLDLLGRLLPESYLNPLMEPGPGYEFLKALAAIGERASVAVAHEATGQYIGAAPDGVAAKGQVAFYRTGTTAGGYTIKAGTVVATEYDYKYQTDSDVTMPAGSTGPVYANVTSCSVVGANQSEMRAYLWNVDAPKLSASGEVLSGGITKIVAPLYFNGATPVFDPTVYVVQTQDIVGGVDTMLDALGQDRGIARLQGQDTEHYRAAIEQLPDTVSPSAIKRAVAAYMAKAAPGKPYDVIEQWETAYQTCYDAPVNVTLPDPNFTVNQLPQTFTSNVFVYDDPRGAYFTNPAAVGLPYHIANRYLSPFPTILLSLPDLGNQQDNKATYSSLGGLLAAVKPAGVQLQFILEGE